MLTSLHAQAESETSILSKGKADLGAKDTGLEARERRAGEQRVGEGQQRLLRELLWAAGVLSHSRS